MKKIYLTLFTVALCSSLRSQTLTAAFNEPVTGDTYSRKFYDSVGVVPKTTGAGQTWNFTPFTQTTVNTISTYSPAGSVPSASNFPGTTLVEIQGGDKIYWKSVPTPTNQFEILGLDQPTGLILSYTNSAIAAQWPVAMGYSLTDVTSGTLSISGMTGTAEGTITTLGSGTGTITLPGNFPVPGIFQTKMTQTIILNVPGISYTNTIISTEYNYYSSSQKFPLLTVSYEKESESVGTPTISYTNKIKVNNAVLTGLNEKNFDANFQIYPNPAKNSFYVNLLNNSGENGTIEIYNSTGKLEKRTDLGNSTLIETQISLEGLSSGVYLVKTKIGQRNSTRKLIIE